MSEKWKTTSEEPLRVSLMDDAVFRALFNTNRAAKTYLLDLVNAILENFNAPQIASLELRDSQIFSFFTDHKSSALDIVAQGNNGETYDIELQNYSQELFNDRLLYYLSKMYGRQLLRGQGYDMLRPVFAIALLGEDAWTSVVEYMFGDDDESYANRYGDFFQMRSSETGALFSPAFNVYIIRVPNENLTTDEIEARLKRKGKLAIWLKAFASGDFLNDNELKNAARHISAMKELRNAMNIYFRTPDILMRYKNSWISMVREKERAKEIKRRERKIAKVVQLQEEKDRIQAEKDRSQAEKDRSQAEKDRSQAEKDRSQAEKDRSQAEKDRSQAEKDRSQAEKDRSQAEKDRSQAEKDRSQAEKDRSLNEREQALIERERELEEKMRKLQEMESK